MKISINLIAILILVTFLYYIVLLFVKPVAYSAYINKLNAFYSNQTLDTLDKISPLRSYGVSVKNLDYSVCRYVVYKYVNPPFIDKLSPYAEKMAVYDICSQLVYNLLMDAVVSDKAIIPAENITKEKITYCLKKYLSNYQYLLMNMDNTPIKECILENNQSHYSFSK